MKFFKGKEFKKIDGVEHIDKVVEVNQQQIGRTPRSNPATYTGVYSEIVGLGLASKIYRDNTVSNSQKFSENGNEIVWGTIGNASTSQGVFFEAVNACGVLQIPAVISIWDDDYGISVHNKDHTTKESICPKEIINNDKGYTAKFLSKEFY